MSVEKAQQHSHRPMAVVHEQKHHSGGRAPTRSPQYYCGRRVTGNEGQIRLDVRSSSIPSDQQEVGPSGGRPVCLQADHPTEEILQLETRSGGGGTECLQPGLEQAGRIGVCQPTMEPDQQSSEQGAPAEGNNGLNYTRVEEPAVVPHTAGDDGGRSSPATTQQQPDHSHTPRGCGRRGSTTGRLAYLRQRYEDKDFSEEGTELLLASWRQKSSKAYDSLFRKWVEWCNERDSDPISGPIGEVVNFLAHLYKEGYQYRSLNSYRSAISSVHEKVDGYEVGQHPLISRVLKGAFNLRPPQPRYETTWDVATVLQYIESLGSSRSLSLQSISWKLAMLLALRPSRSADLVRLDLRTRRYTPDGVVFQEVGLAKQTRQNKPRTEFFFPVFPHNATLCPVETLRVYEQKTESFRSNKDEGGTRLFLAVVRPHKPISSSTLARWLRSMLDKAGIDTGIFRSGSGESPVQGLSVLSWGQKKTPTSGIIW